MTKSTSASTVILQSYRTEGVEGIVSLAMATVRQWAAARGYSYEFLDDSFFDVVPRAFRERTSGAIWQMADMARLLHLNRLLAQYDRAIWVDADVVVLDLNAFRLPDQAEFFFCAEYWVETQFDAEASEISIHSKVNNSICGFRRDAAFLDWYTDKTVRETMGAAEGTNWRTTPLATKILTSTHAKQPFPLYMHCGIMSPGLAEAISRPTVAARVWAAYAGFAKGIAAINMTMSMVRGKRITDVGMLETLGRLWTVSSARPGWAHIATPSALAKSPS